MKKLYTVEIVRAATVVIYCEENEIETVAEEYVDKDVFFDEFADLTYDSNDPIISDKELPYLWTESCIPYTHVNNKEELTIKEILENQNITRNPNNLEFDFKEHKND